MKKFLLSSALMISAFSFANEKDKEMITEQTIQNVMVIENQTTKTTFLTEEDLLTYCWTTVTYWPTGNTSTDMQGNTLYEYEVITRTTCLSV